MGAKQSKRSLDITPSPPSNENAAVAPVESKLNEVVPVDSSQVEQSEEVNKLNDSATNNDADTTVTSTGEDDETSEKKKKEKKRRKKFSFRSLSFSKKDKSKPNYDAESNIQPVVEEEKSPSSADKLEAAINASLPPAMLAKAEDTTCLDESTTSAENTPSACEEKIVTGKCEEKQTVAAEEKPQTECCVENVPAPPLPASPPPPKIQVVESPPTPPSTPMNVSCPAPPPTPITNGNGTTIDESEEGMAEEEEAGGEGLAEPIDGALLNGDHGAIDAMLDTALEKPSNGDKAYDGMFDAGPEQPSNGDKAYDGMFDAGPEQPSNGDKVYDGMFDAGPEQPSNGDKDCEGMLDGETEQPSSGKLSPQLKTDEIVTLTNKMDALLKLEQHQAAFAVEELTNGKDADSSHMSNGNGFAVESLPNACGDAVAVGGSDYSSGGGDYSGGDSGGGDCSGD